MARALEADVRAGLTATPKTLPPKWFYDDRGSELFDEITRLPEYYPTRAERAILARTRRRRSPSAPAPTRSSSSARARRRRPALLLDAFADAGTLARFVPFDVSEETLRERRGGDRRASTPASRCTRSSATSSTTSTRSPPAARRVVAFLGSTIGNFAPEPNARSSSPTVASGLAPGDALLLGTDLVKDVDRLVAAYDDAAGVTAEFNRNVLRVLNRELDADFDVGRVRARRALGPDRGVDRDAPARRAARRS